MATEPKLCRTRPTPRQRWPRTGPRRVQDPHRAGRAHRRPAAAPGGVPQLPPRGSSGTGAVRELAVANLLTELLPVLDDIGRAREHGELVGGFKSVAESLEQAVAQAGPAAVRRGGRALRPDGPRGADALATRRMSRRRRACRSSSPATGSATAICARAGRGRRAAARRPRRRPARGDAERGRTNDAGRGRRDGRSETGEEERQ